MTRPFRTCLIALVFATCATAASASQLTLKSFYGTYEGSGIAEDKDSLYFGITMRDIDVTIAPAGKGFSVQWTTVLRQGGDPDNPDVRRKSSTITFRPTSNPKRFAAVNRTEPLSPEGLSWARLDGQTLTVYVLAISDDGRYNLQSYARTITPNGMELLFTRIKEGAKTRSVRGKLVKTGGP